MNEANEITFEMAMARLRAGLSQQELAKRMRTSRSTISRMESGRDLPTVATLRRLAQVTGHRLEVRLVHVGQ
jgi:transcriptional regulator with XRE-family HTH domain